MKTNILPGKKLHKVMAVIIGLISLVWFLIRVIPKPSRATYPCQRAAFPLASAFVLWAINIIVSSVLYKHSKKLFATSKPYKAIFIIVAAIMFFSLSFFTQPLAESLAGINILNNEKLEFVPMAKRFDQPILGSLPVKVALVQSTRTNVYNITYAEMEAQIREAVRLAGGLDSIVHNGDTVILKPNLVNNKSITNSNLKFNGKVTDYRVVEIVAKIVRELNPDGHIIMLEGSADNKTPSFDIFDNLKVNAANVDYVDEFLALELISGNYKDYKSPLLDSVILHDTVALYPDSRKPNKSRAIYLNKLYMNANVVISIPVLKNHQRAGITGAVKNVGIGCTPANIYAKENEKIRNTEIDHIDNENNVSRWIHDFYACRQVDFTIMDAFQGSQNGPGPYDPMNMRLVLAGKDAVAVDAIAALVMQYDAHRINHLVWLHNHKIGVADPGLIEIVGNVNIPEVRKHFEHSTQISVEAQNPNHVTCNNYQFNYTLENDSIAFWVSNPDTLLKRITLKVNKNNPFAYVLDNFELKQKIATSQLDIENNTINILIEDRYLNRKVLSYNTSFNHQYANKLKMYPNPVNDYLQITNLQSSSIGFKLYNLSGQQLISKEIGLNNAINLSSLPAGLYTAVLTKNGQVIKVQKILKN